MSKFITLWALLFPLPFGVFAQTPNAIYGSVVDSTGAPVSGANVQASSGAARWNATAKTDENGSFSIPSVPAGAVKLTVLQKGFEPDQRSLEGAGRNAPLKIELRPAGLSSSVVVTGGRDAVEIDKSVVAVNAVTEKDIEIRNVRLADQSLVYEEGVNVLRAKGAADTSASVGMRGFAANSARVLVLVDGQPINDGYTGKVPWVAIPVTEMESVEVLRGPGSVLYGGNAMGGVIQMFTRPVMERSVEAMTQYGSYGTTNYSVRYSDRFWKKLGLTLSFSQLREDGYPTAPGLYASASTVTSAPSPLVTAPTMVPSDTGAQRFQIGNAGNNGFFNDAVRAKFDYTLSDKTTVSLQYMQLWNAYEYNTSRPSVLDGSGNPISNGTFYFNYNGSLKKITISPSLFVSGPGGENIAYVTGSIFHTFDAHNWLKVSAGVTDAVDLWFSLPSGSSTFGSGPGTNTYYPNRTSHADAQWNWTPSGRQKYIFGTEVRQDIERSHNYNLSNFASRDSINLITASSEGIVMTEAAFAQADYQLTQKISLELGGRLEDWRTYGGRSQSAPTTPDIALPDRGQFALTGRAGLSWQLSKGLTLRVVGANAFRGPPVYNLYTSSSYPPGTVTLPSPGLKPETVRTWEVGLRKRFGEKISADATYFQNYVHNLLYTAQDLAVDPTGATNITANAGSSEALGVELALRENPFSWLHVVQTYTFNNSRITQNSAVPLSQGRYVTGVPKSVATFSIIGDHKHWTGSLGGHYVSSMYSTNTNIDIVHGVPGSYDGYFVADLTGGYQFPHGVTLFASLENMLDRRYYQYYLAPGRTAYVGLRFRLGGAR
jgi:iron complex outermembrane receptor protein